MKNPFLRKFFYSQNKREKNPTKEHNKKPTKWNKHILKKFNRKDYVKIAVQNWLLNQDIPAEKRFSFEL